MNEKHKIKLDIYKILLTICSVLFVLTTISYQKQKSVLDVDVDGLSKIEAINSGVQRISKLELENTYDNELVESINDISIELVSDDVGTSYFSTSPEIMIIVKNIVADWDNFKLIIEEYRVEKNREILFSVSENNYNDSLTAIKMIGTHIDGIYTSISTTQTMMIVLVATVALLLIKILINTARELKHNKEISKEMYIDTATGIYNRSKCQEMMKMPKNKDEKERAIVIFDLNDLKKTNDSLGHRAGDQLIHDFAQQVKNATNIFSYEIFVGRYGGDEFMALLDSVDEKEVQRYIEEVEYLMNDFNENQGKQYKLSCAAGYSITTKDTRDLTVKELFDFADADMYKNKLAMKEKKRQELREQGIEVVEEVDDRL